MLVVRPKSTMAQLLTAPHACTMATVSFCTVKSLQCLVQRRYAAYYYYASDMRIVGLAQESVSIRAPTETATEDAAKLWRAARFGQLPRVQRLLKLGADVGYRRNEHGTTALHQAVGSSHRDVVEALLEVDASVDDTDHEGKTALHFATSADIVESLVMAGADVDHEDREGKTPGRLALERKNMAVVEALISGRADPSKFFEPREGTDSSRFETSSKQSEGEDTNLQHYHVRGAPDPPENYKQDAGGRVSALAKYLHEGVTYLPIRNRNYSSVPTPDDRLTEQVALQPHTIRPGRDQMCEQDFACHVPSAPSPGDCDQLSAAHNPLTLDNCDQGSRLIIAIVRMSSKPATTPSAHKLLQNLLHSLTVDVQVFYAVEPGDRSPESYVNNQDDEHGMTKSNLTPHKDLVLHMLYDDLSVTRVFRRLRQQFHRETSGSRVGDFDRTGKSEGDRLSDYFEVLGTQITFPNEAEYRSTIFKRRSSSLSLTCGLTALQTRL